MMSVAHELLHRNKVKACKDNVHPRFGERRCEFRHSRSLSSIGGVIPTALTCVEQIRGYLVCDFLCHYRSGVMVSDEFIFPFIVKRCGRRTIVCRKTPNGGSCWWRHVVFQKGAIA